MADYDFKAAKKYVQMHSDLIISATLGMHEDWFWTSEIIYQGGKFTKDLDDVDLKIAGINGSFWATPILEIEMKDGREIRKECYTGAAGGQAPEWFSLGVLSQECQDVRSGKFIE